MELNSHIKLSLWGVKHVGVRIETWLLIRGTTLEGSHDLGLPDLVFGDRKVRFDNSAWAGREESRAGVSKGFD